jgi:hypothetical protein
VVEHKIVKSDGPGRKPVSGFKETLDEHEKEGWEFRGTIELKGTTKGLVLVTN